MLRSFRFALARMLVKSAGFSVVPPWISHSVLLPSFRSLTSDAYQKNAAFFACVSSLVFAFGEPPLLVWDDESDAAQPLPNHPVQKLLRKPNPLMGERAFAVRLMTYKAIGGNCYVHKVRSQRGDVVELWPYHDGQVRPIPGGPTWVRGYEFVHTNTEPEYIPSEDIIHLQWPNVDPKQPWMAQPPLLAAASEVDADNEATRYLRALLQNDAVPRTVVTQPPNITMTPDEKRRFREQWAATYGGDNRAGVAILDDGATVERLGLNLEELAFEAMHAIPETRIAAVMRVPPIIAGLSTGLSRSTYSNYKEARTAFTEQTMAPLWAITADALQEGLQQDFGDVVIGYDTNQVAALQEDTTQKWNRVLAAYNAGLIEDADEARGLINLPKLVRPTVTVTKPQPLALADSEPPALTDGKSRKASAQRVAARLRRLRATVARSLEVEVATFFDDLADRVVARAGKARDAAETKELPTLARLLRAADMLGLEEAIKEHIVTLLSSSWPLLNDALSVSLAFDLEDPAVALALKESATRVKGITDTTRDAMRGILSYGASQGWSIDELIDGADGKPGLRTAVEEAYQGRARTIARTEMGMAQNSAAAARYAAAGISRVEVLDGGGDDSDDICNQLNGSIQTLEWAKANPLQHPNCVRAFSPVVE